MMTRKKKTWLRVLLITGSVLAVTGLGAYVALDMAVDYTLKQVVSEIENQPEAPSAEGSQEGQAANDSAIGEPSNDKPMPGKTASPHSDGQAETAGGDAEGSDPLAYTPQITRGKAEQVQEAVTTGEKAAVASVLVKSFSAGELQQFASMAKDGITVEDKKAVRELFLERLSEEEYNQLIQIAAKYGLSQGKSYSEVKKESGE